MSKNIFISNSGSYAASPASYDENNSLSSSVKIAANTASFIGQNGILQIKNNMLTPVADGTIADSGSVLAYTQGVGFEPKQIETPQLSGDISGNNITGVRVRNISNVSSGVLSSSSGGLGTSSHAQNSIIITSGSGPIYGESNKILAVIDNNGTWGLVDKNILESNFTPMTEALVYLYTGSISATSSFIWTKPAGCRFIKIICQGGGGGGAAGVKGGSTNLSRGGRGGAGGGYGEILLSSLCVSNQVVVSAGAGGAGGFANGGAGGAGGQSSFGTYLYSNGGAGGYYTGVDASVAVGGLGYVESGANTGTHVTANGLSKSYSGASGASGGNLNNGNGAAGGSCGNAAGGAAGLQSGPTSPRPSALDGQNGSQEYIIGGYAYINENTFLSEIPKLRCGAGGSGASLSSATLTFQCGNGGHSAYGSGGGGGAGTSTGGYNKTFAGNGGNGGVGYVLIICY